MNEIAALTQEEAFSHLFFHCCYADGEFTDAEIKTISDKLVAAGLHRELNFRDEIIKYKAYRPLIKDEQAYLQQLIDTIKPANELALYSYCIEMCLGDTNLSAVEESLLKKLAAVLEINETTQDIIIRLMVQRRVAETQNLY